MVERKTFGRTGREVSEIGMGTYYDPLWIATDGLAGAHLPELALQLLLVPLLPVRANLTDLAS